MATKTTGIDKLRAARQKRASNKSTPQNVGPSTELQELNTAVAMENSESGKTASLAERLYNSETVLLPIDELKDSPAERNFFSIDETRLESLKADIRQKGVLEPIIVHEIAPETIEGRNVRYEILAGHTRVKASRQLISELNIELAEAQGIKTQEEINEIKLAITRLSQIKSIIAIVDSEEEAQEITLDTNFQQRKLTSAEYAKCIYMKVALFKAKSDYDKLEKNKDKNKLIVDMLKSEYGLSEKTAYEWNMIAKLSPKLFSLVQENGLSVHASMKLQGLALSAEDEEKLCELVKAHPGAFTNAKVMKLGKKMAYEDIEQTLIGDSKKIYQKISFLDSDINDESDVLQLVFVKKEEQEAFMEYIKGFKGAYTVKNLSRNRNSVKKD